MDFLEVLRNKAKKSVCFAGTFKGHADTFKGFAGTLSGCGPYPLKIVLQASLYLDVQLFAKYVTFQLHVFHFCRVCKNMKIFKFYHIFTNSLQIFPFQSNELMF